MQFLMHWDRKTRALAHASNHLTQNSIFIALHEFELQHPRYSRVRFTQLTSLFSSRVCIFPSCKLWFYELRKIYYLLLIRKLSGNYAKLKMILPSPLLLMVFTCLGAMLCCQLWLCLIVWHREMSKANWNREKRMNWTAKKEEIWSKLKSLSHVLSS